MSPPIHHNPGESWPGGHHDAPLREILADIRSKQNEMCERMEGIDLMLRGDGNSQVGVFVRLDRLEMQAAAATFWTRTAIGAAVAACIAEVVGWFKHSGS